MKKTTLKFEDFQNEELTKKQKLMVKGGDESDPGKTGGGNGNP